MRRTMSRMLCGLVLATLLGSLLTVVASPKAAEAANPSTFDAGFIIDDRLFYNGSLMSEAAIQAFLDGKVACAATAGNPGCLEFYRVDSTSRAADQYCSAYEGGTGELASRVIYKVAIACNINPQVLMVTLQKERGLITKTNPSAADYKVAMGYGCPDTAACDTKYYGFANQLISASRQFNAYAKYPTSFRYRAGVVNTVQWHPNAACGSSQFIVQNNATAGLYNYTPYRPNQAAMSNLYGTGDSCSSYGNRNFWAYFTDWFGSTTVSQGAVSFVKALYADILGRAPSDSEVVGWGRQLMNGVPAAEVAAGFVNSDEYRLIRIMNAYRTILGREGETSSVYGWLGSMKRGELGTDDVDRVFLATDEYLLRSGGTNESFVTALYSHLLGRPITAGEVGGWASIAATAGRQTVVDGIRGSVEAARQRVTIMYQAYLGRSPAAGEVNGWADLAIAQGDAGVRWSIVASPEYWARAAARFPA